MGQAIDTGIPTLNAVDIEGMKTKWSILLLFIIVSLSCKPPAYQFTATLIGVEESRHTHYRGFPSGAWTDYRWQLTFDNGEVIGVHSRPNWGVDFKVGAKYSVYKSWVGMTCLMGD